MNKEKPPVRARLLLCGMGIALFALTATTINAALLPFARALYGYSALPCLAAMAATLGLIAFVSRRMARADEERLARIAGVTRPAFLLLLLAVHLLMGYLMEYTPMGDNHMLYDGPATLARLGNFGGDDYDLYLARYSNQWGFFLMVTGFFKLLLALGIENRFYALVVVQAALYALAMYSLLRMARNRFGVRAELMLTLLLALCLPLWLAAAVLYTDTFSLPFVVFALIFALRVPEQKHMSGVLLSAFLCGLMAFIGCQIKMTVAIVLMAAVIVWALTMRFPRALAAALLSGAIVIGGTQAVHRVMTTFVLDPAMVEQNHTPTIHWVMMSIPTADNPYGGYAGDYGITWGMQEAGATKAEVMDSIYARMKDRIYTLRYPNRLALAVLRKNANSQGDGSFGMTEMLDDGPVRPNGISEFVLESGRFYPLYAAICSGVWFAMLACAALQVFADIRRRDMRRVIPIIALLGMQLFLLIWEARSRYMFSFVPAALLLAACGGARMTDCMNCVKEGWLCTAFKNLWIKRRA